jgi:general secretion pathway protein D
VTPTAPGSTAPGATPVSMGGGTLFEKGAFGGTSNPIGANQAGGGPAGILQPTGTPNQQAGANANQFPAAEGLSAADTGAAVAPDRIRIIPNNRNNALLIYATPSEYSMIHGMLVKIDILSPCRY